jgi:hypothetical protein
MGDGRHRFLAVVANDAFGLGNPNTVEATMSEHVELFEEFFKPTTSQSTVFIAYQPRLVENDLGKLVRTQAAQPCKPTRCQLPPVPAAPHTDDAAAPAGATRRRRDPDLCRDAASGRKVRLLRQGPHRRPEERHHGQVDRERHILVSFCRGALDRGSTAFGGAVV